MYQASDKFIQRLNETSRRFNARIKQNDQVLDIGVKTILLTTGSCGADTFTVGSVFASYADIVLDATDISLTGKEILLEIGLILSDGVEYVPMGYFTAQKPSDITKERDQTTVKVVDRITTKCSGLYVPTVGFPCSVQNLLDDVAKQAGITIVTSFDTSGTIKTAPNGLMYREVLGYIAGLLGGFCYADRDGNIRLAPHPETSSVEVAAERFYELKPAEDAYSVNALTVIVSEGGEDADGNQVEGESFSDGSGTGVTLFNPYMTSELFASMKEWVMGYSFYSGTAQFLGDPRIGPEDAITAVNSAGRKFFFPGMSIIQDFDGGLTTTIATPGMAVSDEAAKGPLTQQVERLQSEMVLAKEVIAKKITADEADIKYASIEKATILEAEIEILRTEMVTTENLKANFADIHLANIDIANIDKAKIGELFAEVGLITKAVIEDGHVTGYLDSVSINASSIKAGTLSVDRLVINGTEESIIYALNNAGELTSTNVNTLDGGLLTERTVTADKLVAHSITANEITTSNIVGANGWINLAEATFNYGNELIWDGKKLTIAAQAITMVANDLYAKRADLDNLQIGGRNLIRNSKNLIFEKYYFGVGTPRLDGDILLDESGNILLDENGDMLVA